ncbi:MAG: hypothetical protein KDD06_18130, partial [Phaeodactylibacter sp.]|nr:hypothetical protein [Phaeodactylibacter sp.]
MLKQSMKWSWILILAVAAFMVACDKEQTDSLTENAAVDTRTVSNVDLVSLEVDGMEHGPRCFTLKFPVWVVYPNGDEVMVESPESLRGLFLTWREENPNAMDRPTLRYPYTVIMNDDGEEVPVNNRDELLELLAECRATMPGGGGPGFGPNGPGHGGHHGFGPGDFGPGFGFNSPCFSLQYSVTVYFPGIGEQVFDNEEDLRTAIKDWREANPGPADELPYLVMPYTVILDDGNTFTVETDADLDALHELCRAFSPCDCDPQGPGNNG